MICSLDVLLSRFSASGQTKLLSGPNTGRLLTQGQEERAVLQLHVVAWGQASWLRHTCPAQKTTEESLIPAHCVLLLHPAELSACFLFYPQHCLSWCTAVYNLENDKWISSASYVNLQTSEGRKHLNRFTCIFTTEFRVVQAMIKRRSTTNRVRAKSLQSYPTLCDPMDCSPPGFCVHWILQARVLEWVAMPSSRGSSQDQTHISYVSCIDRQVSYTRATWEAHRNRGKIIYKNTEAEKSLILWNRSSET